MTRSERASMARASLELDGVPTQVCGDGSFRISVAGAVFKIASVDALERFAQFMRTPVAPLPRRPPLRRETAS